MFTKSRRSPQQVENSPIHVSPTKSKSLRPQASPAKSNQSVSWQRDQAGPRSGMSLENFQSYGGAYSINHGYMDAPMSLSPYNSPTHVHMRSNSATNISMKSGPRYMSDRDLAMSDLVGSSSLDRYGNFPAQRDGGREVRRSGGGGGGNSLHRERSLDRDYPYMGARSLERDQYYRKMGRSHSIELEQPMYPAYLSSQTLPPPPSKLSHQESARDNAIFDMQTQIMDLTKECAVLQHEIDSARGKLAACMNSIKTFWSPELKKERATRKDETTRCLNLNEQYKIAQAELQRYKALLNDSEGVLTNLKSHDRLPPYHDPDTHKKDEARQKKELQILHKTIEELELRIETQKQTLQTRDESIKKLLEMLQSKGLSVGSIEEDRQHIEKLQRQIVEDKRRLKQVQDLLELRDKEITTLRENSGAMNPPANSASTQALIEAKEARIASLENQVSTLQEECVSRESDGLPVVHNRERKMHGFGSEEKTLRAELEVLKNELARKDNEIIGVTMKSETFEKQQLEHQQYIQVLKEQINAKELHASMLQSDIEDLRERLKDKEEVMDKKAKQVITTQTEKRRLESENVEMKEHSEIRDRKIIVLQRKLENLEDLLREKETSLSQTQARLATMTHGQSSSDTALAEVQESLGERDKLVERLKEQRTITEQEHQDEVTGFRGQIQELKSRLEVTHTEMSNKQGELCENRDELCELKAEKLRTETFLKDQEAKLCAKDQKINALSEQLNKTKETLDKKTDVDPEVALESERRIGELTNEIVALKEEINKMQQELDRLLEILRETEDEKHEKDNQLKELQESLKEYKSKMGTLKRNSQLEKTMNAQMLEEARKREDDTVQESTNLQRSMHERDERIEELEEALRESVGITAEREIAMAEQEHMLDERQRENEAVEPEMRKLRSTIEDHTNTIAILNKQLEDRETKIKKYGSERRKQMDEVYEMKMEALQAAICEKDANIALIELTSTKMNRNFDETKKLQTEKTKLQDQLKEVSQNRMRLHSGEDRHSNGHRRTSQAKITKQGEPSGVPNIVITS